MIQMKRRYLSVDDIQKEYLPVSKKKIRALIKQYLQVKILGGRMYTEREAFERLLSDPDRERLPLD